MPWAELTDSRCYYELLGEGDPLLLINGLGTTCRIWDPIVPDLAKSFTLLLSDSRDLGRSTGRRAPTTLADFSSDLVELLDYLQLDRAHVLGVSLGGVIAQRLARDHPDRIRRLVLVSCADGFSPYLTQVWTLLGYALRRFPPEMFARTVELLGSAPQFFDENVPLIDQRIRNKCGSGISARAIEAQLQCLAREQGAPPEDRITAPTLVIAGDHDALIPACYSKAMAEKIPGSRFVLVRGGGHNPLSDFPDRMAPLITAFLGGHLQESADAYNSMELQDKEVDTLGSWRARFSS